MSDRDNGNGPCLVTASPGNSPDIDSLNRLIESEFHTRGPAGVKTVLCVIDVARVSGQHVYTRGDGTWSHVTGDRSNMLRLLHGHQPPAHSELSRSQHMAHWPGPAVVIKIAIS